MWKRTEKPKTMLVTKALAKEFFEMEKIPKERPLSEKRLLVYRRILEAGEFRPVTWASAYCKETGATYRINGQHTSTLLSESDKLPEFYVTVERYECATMEDVARLYATFDSNISSRTANDIIQSFASTAKELNSVRKKTLPLVVGAASYEKWGLEYYSHLPAERAELLLDNIEFALWVDSILWPTDVEQDRATHLNRQAVVTAMLGTWNKAHGDSDTFWKHVRDEDLDREDPTRILARFLTRSSPRTSMKPSGKVLVTFREMYVKCLHGWNAWRKNQPTDLKYYQSAKIPAIQ